MSEGRNKQAALLNGKRVVFVLAGEVLGGAERGALDLARDFKQVEGASVGICALDDRPGLARELSAEYKIPWSCIRIPWAGNRVAKAASLARFARGLRRLSPDVLVSSTNKPNVACGLTWRTTGASLSIWNQCDVNGTTRFSRGLFRRALSSTPIVVTAAKHAGDWLVETFGADPRRVYVVPTPLRLRAPRESGVGWRARLGLRENDVVACMLGHLHEGKDHATLLRAWRLVADRLTPEGRRPVLILAGRDAGGEPVVKALAFDLDLREYVVFAGEVDDVSGLLSAADLAVFSSRRECFPRGAMEPMSVGLAVAGTDVPGVREAVGMPGVPYLAPPGDAPALADAILRLAGDPVLRASLGRANAELIRSRQSGEATSRVYARLLADGLAGRLPYQASDTFRTPSW